MSRSPCGSADRNAWAGLWRVSEECHSPCGSADRNDKSKWQGGTQTGRSLYGSADRNCGFAVFSVNSTGSLLVRERGSKSTITENNGGTAMSLPIRECGLKQHDGSVGHILDVVARPARRRSEQGQGVANPTHDVLSPGQTIRSTCDHPSPHATSTAAGLGALNSAFKKFVQDWSPQVASSALGGVLRRFHFRALARPHGREVREIASLPRDRSSRSPSERQIEPN